MQEKDIPWRDRRQNVNEDIKEEESSSSSQSFQAFVF